MSGSNQTNNCLCSVMSWKFIFRFWASFSNATITSPMNWTISSSDAFTSIFRSSIFLKSINWFTNRSRRIAFFRISDKFSFKFALVSAPRSTNSSIGAIISVSGVLNSCDILVKNFNFSCVATSAFSAIAAMVSRCSRISRRLASSLLFISFFSRQL